MKNFMQASTKPKAYIPCYYKECNSLHVELQWLCDGIHQHCPIEEKPIPDHYYCDIFSNKGNVEFFKNVLVKSVQLTTTTSNHMWHLHTYV